MEFETYEDLVEGLRNLPVTWYPAILSTIVERTMELDIWKDGEDGLANFLCVVIDKKKEELHNAKIRLDI